jgi:class 3 adenylate cyclase
MSGENRWSSARHTRAVAIAGLTLAIACAAADAGGLFERAERRSLDWRFEVAPRDEPLSDAIRFVDLDDAALDFGGRWPWPRAQLAAALAEIARAGARTVALDLLLNEPEGDGSGDRALAQALGTTASVVALESGAADPWTAAPRERREARDLLLHEIAQRWTAAPAEVLAAARPGAIDSTLARDFELRPRTWRQLAARRELLHLERHSTAPVEFAAFSAALVGKGVEAGEGDRALLADVYRDHVAWARMRGWILEDAPADAEPSLAARPPLPELVDHAAGAGFVDSTADSDGGLREVVARRVVPGGLALQFGFAAARVFRDDAPVPRKVDRLLLAWPSVPRGAKSDDAWLRMAPRISLGRMLDLARTRGALARPILLRQFSSHDIAAAAGIATDGSEDRMLEKVREEARFRCDDAATTEAKGGLTEAERAAVQPFRDFARVDEIVRAGQASLDDAEHEAHRLLDGRLVFVGWTATGAASDFVPTPLGARTPGVVAHAVAADMVLSARSYRSLAPFLSPLLALAVGALATATTLLPALAAAGAGLGLLGGVAWVAVALLFAREHLVVPLVAPLASGIAAWVGATATRAALAQLDAQRITRQFKARVAPELVDYLVGHPDALSMAGEPREVTAFFLDLAGFTSVSERLGARDSVALLNRCMNAATVALTRHQAYVNKYLGDGLMAFWSAFRPDAEQAGRACRAALEVMEELARTTAGEPIHARIGIATGRVIVGDCGAPPLLHDFTAIGDAINLAARLESANKQFGTRILVDGRTREQAGDAGLRFRPLARVVVVGQSVAVELHELVPAAMSEREIELTAAAVAAWQAGDAAACAARFGELRREFGATKLERVYLDDLSEEAGAAEPGARVLHLKAK